MTGHRLDVAPRVGLVACLLLVAMGLFLPDLRASRTLLLVIGGGGAAVFAVGLVVLRRGAGRGGPHREPAPGGGQGNPVGTVVFGFLMLAVGTVLAVAHGRSGGGVLGWAPAAIVVVCSLSLIAYGLWWRSRRS